MYTLPLYEAKYNEKEDWEEITEIQLMDGLYRIYKKVTPAIKEMLEGKEIFAPEAVYRLKMKGGVQSEMPTA